MKPKIPPNNVEVPVGEADLIVSKTDTKGRITYANRAFMRIAGYSARELIGAQHNIIRHPDMPRGVFRLLWRALEARRECFAYVKNMTADGSFYWVLANVTPDVDAGGRVRGYHSVRRHAQPSALREVTGLYREMLAIERRSPAASAPDASLRFLEQKLAELNTEYDRFVLSL